MKKTRLMRWCTGKSGKRVKMVKSKVKGKKKCPKGASLHTKRIRR